MAIKKAASLEDRERFINETKRTKEQKTLLEELQAMTPDELLDRFESMYFQQQIVMWIIIAQLRSRFPSKKEFGQYLAKMRVDNPVHPLWANKESTITRYINAGQFVLKHNISDLNDVGISATVVYMLSEKINASVSDVVYKKVRIKNYSVAEVARIINQEKSLQNDSDDISTTETDNTPEQLKPPSEKKLILVVDNVAQEAHTQNVLYVEPEVPYQEVAERIDYQHVAKEVEETDSYSSEIIENVEYVRLNEHENRMIAIRLLNEISSKGLSEEDIFEELQAVCISLIDSNTVSFLTMNKILKSLTDFVSKFGYGH